jgi:hypothetical protein
MAAYDRSPRVTQAMIARARTVGRLALALALSFGFLLLVFGCKSFLYSPNAVSCRATVVHYEWQQAARSNRVSGSVRPQVLAADHSDRPNDGTVVLIRSPFQQERDFCPEPVREDASPRSPPLPRQLADYSDRRLRT